MSLKPFKTYSEVPEQVITFIKNVTGDNITCFTLQEINQTLSDLEEYYESQGQKIQDYLE
jgi:hypothetical protein